MKKLLQSFLSVIFSEEYVKVLKKTRSIFLEKKKFILLIFIISFTLFFFDLISIFLLGSLTDNNQIKNSYLFSFIIDVNISTILFVVIVIQILREIFNFFNQYLPGFLSSQIEYKIRTESMEKVFNNEIKILQDENKNHLIFKIHSQTVAYANFISENIKILNNTTLILFYVFFIFYYQPTPSLIILSNVFIIFFLTNSLIIKQQIFGMRIRNYQLDLHNKLSDIINGFRDIISHEKKKTFYNQTKKNIKNLIYYKLKSLKFQSLFSPLVRSILIIILSSVMFVYLLIYDPNIEKDFLSTAIIYLFLLFRIQAPLIEINSLRSSAMTRLAATQSIVDLNETSKNQKKIILKNKELKFTKEIRFNNLNFGYDKKKILKDINLSIKKNKIVGFFGKPGSGKTSLVNLLFRFHNIDANKITIDDICINKISKKSVRKSISMVTQNGYLFNESVMDNITMFSKFEKNKFEKVTKISGVNDYIKTLPKKFNTIIGGKEIPLSGGQKQRILIARALYKDCPILILDEATSSQDSISELKILQQIKTYKKNLTIVIIAHRFTALRHSDYIYCLHNGRIIEEGDWKYLVSSKNSEFKKYLKSHDLS